jgi:flagellar motor switch protein FliG
MSTSLHPVKLTGVQKAAVILSTLPKEQATVIMRQLSEEERVQIGKSLATLPDVDSDVTTSVMSELRTRLHAGEVSSKGGRVRATELMTAAFGNEEWSVSTHPSAVTSSSSSRASNR